MVPEHPQQICLCTETASGAAIQKKKVPLWGISEQQSSLCDRSSPHWLSLQPALTITAFKDLPSASQSCFLLCRTLKTLWGAEEREMTVSSCGLVYTKQGGTLGLNPAVLPCFTQRFFIPAWHTLDRSTWQRGGQQWAPQCTQVLFSSVSPKILMHSLPDSTRSLEYVHPRRAWCGQEKKITWKHQA